PEGEATDSGQQAGTAATATIARPVDVFFSGSVSAESADDPAANESPEQTSSGRSENRSARSLMEPGQKRSKSKAGSKASGTRSNRGRASAANTAAADADDDADGSTEQVGTPTEKTAAPSRKKAATGRRTAASSSSGHDSSGHDSSGHDATDDTSATGDGAAAGSAEPELVPVPGATFAELPVEAIMPNPRQPREVFDEEELEELAASIREVGVLQPVVVRPMAEPTEDGVAYELIMGERRWRAARAADSSTIPAVIRETSDADLLRDALLENLHRSNLNPLEEAAAYNQLLEDFGCTHDELATRIARSRPQISNSLRLMKLPPLVQRRVAAGVLSAGHARALLGLSDAAAMERLAQRIVAEGLSVRATEEIVALGEVDGEEKPARRTKPRAGMHRAALDDLSARLSDRLDTKVKVNL